MVLVCFGVITELLVALLTMPPTIWQSLYALFAKKDSAIF
mgnify:CR=1 FL=1